MPELPEVETVRRQLDFELPDKKISRLEIKSPKLIRGSAVFFKKKITGRRIEKVGRRAKMLVIGLSGGDAILIHLKMTGQLVYRRGKITRSGGHPIKGGDQDLPNKYTHVIFSFAEGGKLFFNDLRRFGYLKLVKKAALPALFSAMKLGPEPLEKEFTFEVFQRLLSSRPKTKIKPLLMDQTFVAGLGNIYAAEACFYAGVNPARPAGRLSLRKAKKLFAGIKMILKKAVAKQGSSPDNYVDAYGQPGEYVPLLKVYGRKGEACYRCGAKIKGLVLAGRGTAFCPRCQRF